MAAGDHTGRFKADDTIRKWFLRIFATIGVLATLAAVLVIVGIAKLVT